MQVELPIKIIMEEFSDPVVYWAGGEKPAESPRWCGRAEAMVKSSGFAEVVGIAGSGSTFRITLEKGKEHLASQILSPATFIAEMVLSLEKHMPGGVLTVEDNCFMWTKHDPSA